MGDAGMKRINLIPPEYAVGRKAFFETNLRDQVVALSILLIIGMSAHYWFLSSKLRPLEKEVTLLTEEAKETEVASEAKKRAKATLQAQIENVEHRMSLAGKKKTSLMHLKGSQAKWSDILESFKKSIPEKVWVENFVLSEEENKVSGGAFDNKTIGRFIENLNGSRFFKNASFTKTEAGETAGKKVVNFELGFDLVRSS